MLGDTISQDLISVKSASRRQVLQNGETQPTATGLDFGAFRPVRSIATEAIWARNGKLDRVMDLP